MTGASVAPISAFSGVSVGVNDGSRVGVTSGEGVSSRVEVGSGVGVASTTSADGEATISSALTGITINKGRKMLRINETPAEIAANLSKTRFLNMFFK